MSSRANNKLLNHLKGDDEEETTKQTNGNGNQLVKKKSTRRKITIKPKKPANDDIFFKVWRNKVLFDAIYGRARLITHIRRYNTKFTVKELQDYDHRSYLKKIILSNDKDNIPDLSDPLSLPTPLPLPPGLLPATTEYLDLNRYCIINQGDIPDGVVNIGFGKALRNINFIYIPKSVTKLQFSSLTSVAIPEGGIGLETYNNLEVLTIDIGSLQLLEYLNRFPKLKVLCINGSDGRDIVIPEGIRKLIFGSTFNSKLPTTYPDSLIIFKLGIGFTKKNAFSLQSLPPNIQKILIRAYRIHSRLDDFCNFKKLTLLQYFSTKPYDKLDGRLVSDSFPCLEEVYHNNREKFKNKNGILVLEKSFNLIEVATQPTQPTQQPQPIQ